MAQEIREQLQKTLGTGYTLDRELGGGGMSRVFVVDEHRLKRKIVVKVLSPELAQGISVERFEREIQTAAALQQANIVPVFSAGETNGLPFYMMPFVEGESLRARLGRGPLSITEVIGVLRDVSKALAYAHRHGVVHRDIKPDNVLLSEGTAVVTDFGIAKAISAARTESGQATLTQIGTSIGTPAYMAPEQAAGDPNVDTRADIYSLGAMAYELLAGQAPFAGRTPQRVLAAHMAEVPKLISELRGDIPGALAELVMACLEKDADKRPTSAADVTRVLEQITSGSAMPAMPAVLIGGPGMFRKALAIYAATFVAVGVFARAAILVIGLPEWVFPGALLVMAMGLPVVLWTGYVQRVVRKSVTTTPVFTPGGTASAAQHGTIATMALKAAPNVSWSRTARRGSYAMATFVFIVAAFMVMRALGIGPVGSLLASGALKQDDKILLDDFSVSGGADTTLGRVVSDAVRAGLAQAQVFSVMSPAEVGAALGRMQRPATSIVTLAVARDLALRNGGKAVVDGNIASVAGTYILSVRLVTADSARELTSYRSTAASVDKLIDAADKVSRELRAKAGESLRRVNATTPLSQATTASFEALRKYSEASRANDVENNPLRAVGLLREAVAIDSNFAEGWRKLAVAMGNQGMPQSSIDSAVIRAYALRGRLGDTERDIIEGYYFTNGPEYNRGKGIAAYERVLARGDSAIVMVNLAGLVQSRREYARAESLIRADIRRRPGRLIALANLAFALALQQNVSSLDSLVAVVRKEHPDVPDFVGIYLNGLNDHAAAADLERALDSARRVGNQYAPGLAYEMSAGHADDQGQLRKWAEYRRESLRLDSAVGRRSPSFHMALATVRHRASDGLPVDDELRALDAALARQPLEQMPRSERPYFDVAQTYAIAGRPDRARAYMEQWRRAFHDSIETKSNIVTYRIAQGWIAIDERRWFDAVKLWRASDTLSDGPAYECAECLPRGLSIGFSIAGMPDSAIAQYELYLRTPYGSRKRAGPDWGMDAPWIERLAHMYELKGDTAHAAEMYQQFIERWKNADPELQPRVAAARARLRRMQLDAPKS